MKKFLNLIALIILAALFIVQAPQKISAREASQIKDWYLKDFITEITLSTDDTIEVVERLTADCGNLPGRHGIFRVLPTFYKTDKGKIKAPIELVSITDFSDKPLKFRETKNRNTVTWKIGDPDKTVTGINNYKITYKVKNVVRFSSDKFDEFYWNLNGNFWQIETDHFLAKINFPPGITRENAKFWHYAPEKVEVRTGWNGSFYEVEALDSLRAGEGITLSATFPKNIITPYKFGFIELYGWILWFALPFLVFIACFWAWSKYGRDPKGNPVIVPEFEVPGKLPPLILGAVLSQGTVENKYIAAQTVYLAVKKIIKIEEGEKSWLGGKDYNLTLLENNLDSLSKPEQTLIKAFFGDKDKIALSDLKDSFAKDVSSLNDEIKEILIKNNYYVKSGFGWRTALIIIGILTIILSFVLGGVWQSWTIGFALALSGVIIFVFGLLMMRLSPEGAEMMRKIKGFELYMKTAERYRQKFNEKENIFERFLPYAIMFGITSLWITKMKEIYGEKYFENYHPYWYVGSVSSFNGDSFNSAISSLSTAIATNTAVSSSGSGGGGFSGGGGGGGGGGGW